MKLSAFLAPSLVRLFPLGPAGKAKSLRLLAARGERVSFQVGFTLEGPDSAELTAEAHAGGGLHALVRRVGHVPVPHHNTDTPDDERDGLGHVPGYVPDPLFPLHPEQRPRFARGEVGAFWISVDVPTDAKPGTHDVTVSLRSGLREGDKVLAQLTATVEVSKVVLATRRDFRACHWFYADALADFYKVETWSEPHWGLCEKYFRNYASHGLDTLYVPAFTPPTDGVKRPTQLLKVRKLAGGKYDFDWANVRRWIAAARRAGVTHWEWVHLFSQWGVRNCIRIYEDPATEKLIMPADTPATSPRYRAFLAQFLPAFKKFLDQEKLFSNSFFHLSDEPHGDEALANYRAARAVLRELAPWMKVFDALSDITYGREKLTDIPVPVVSSTRQFVDEGIPCWTYYCCGPRGRYLNRLLDTPLAKIRMNGWLFRRFNVGGFLHWGYNYWYKSQSRQLIDPFSTTDAHAWPGWAYGDPFVVYPGPIDVGPIDSIRWEVFGESMQDFRLLQTLGVAPGDKLLAPLRDFNDFPKNADWISRARRKLLSR